MVSICYSNGKLVSTPASEDIPEKWCFIRWLVLSLPFRSTIAEACRKHFSVLEDSWFCLSPKLFLLGDSIIKSWGSKNISLFWFVFYFYDNSDHSESLQEDRTGSVEGAQSFGGGIDMELCCLLPCSLWLPQLSFIYNSGQSAKGWHRQ